MNAFNGLNPHLTSKYMASNGYSIIQHADCQSFTIDKYPAQSVKFFTDDGGRIDEVKFDKIWFGLDPESWEGSWKIEFHQSNQPYPRMSYSESGGNPLLCTVFRARLQKSVPVQNFDNNNITFWGKSMNDGFHLALVYHMPSIEQRSNGKPNLPREVNTVLLPIKTYVAMTNLGYVISDEADCSFISRSYKLEDISFFNGGDDPLTEIRIFEERANEGGTDTLIGYWLKTQDYKQGEEKSIIYVGRGEHPKSICSIAHFVFSKQLNNDARFDDFTLWNKDDEIALLYYKSIPRLANQLRETEKEGMSPTKSDLLPFNKWHAVGGATLAVPALTLGYYLHRRARKAAPQKKKTRLNV
jgi:hypothetical protein